MQIAESVKMAIMSLTANKLRSSLTMLGMIIGNASVIAMIGIGQGAQKYTIEKLESFGQNRLVVFINSEEVEGFIAEKPTLVLSDAEAIATQAPSVKEVAPLIGSKLLISYRSRSTQTNVTGTTPGALYIRNAQVARGRFFDQFEQQQNAQVVVLGSDVASKLFGSDRPIGKEVQINNLSFQVIGVMQAKGAFLGPSQDDIAYVPITTMANQLAGRKSAYGIPVDYIEISAQDKSSLRAAAFQITNLVTRRHGKKDFAIVANKSFQNLVSQIAGTLSLTLAAIAGISLLVGGVGIMNIMLVSVSERTQEIGLRKAIGATQQAILTQFLIEAVMLSIAGGLVGTGIGIGSGMVIAVLTPIKPSVPLAAIALSVGVSGSIGLIFGVIPARQAARLDPIVALRSA